MSQQRIGIIMHGVTGRMGLNQHLIHSVLALRDEGVIGLADGTRLVPDPILVGRNQGKLEALARAHGVARWSTDLDAALADPRDSVFFDAASTKQRPGLLARAIDAGKHVYCEKPVSETLEEAVAIARHARARGVKNGIVHDKLNLPGLLKLRRLRDSGFFGRILSVRGEFGYWVFEGDWQPAQRPSWNYRRAEGGASSPTCSAAGATVAGLHSCRSQHRVNTPKPVWNPNEPQTLDFYDGWAEVPDNAAFDNGFKTQWIQFLRHVAEDAPWRYTLAEGAKGVQLAELGYRSWRERRWIDVPELEV